MADLSTEVIEAHDKRYIADVRAILVEYQEWLGFVENELYRYNPIDGAKYMELDLNTLKDPDAP